MFNLHFWTKYFFRVVHIVSMIVLSSHIINEMFNEPAPTNSKMLFMAMGVAVALSGTSSSSQVLLTLFSLNRMRWAIIANYG